ncbi:hypothetical protein SORBI_3004G347833 [Sorghum bicolor]|uniref:Uncharacterized protein n=1 Tax=Sorghum bicolor TaxID=4558 RepID=A0A1Z5RQL9_SORBI|nr:hypothetical protein SORBI_3004G347833 [Sorghum bicolor]
MRRQGDDCRVAMTIDEPRGRAHPYDPQGPPSLTAVRCRAERPDSLGARVSAASPPPADVNATLTLTAPGPPRFPWSTIQMHTPYAKIPCFVVYLFLRKFLASFEFISQIY